MATHTQDDGFHEIQLNGKQLVFFFMAATVVMVVVFLCGVLVGRGVRTERGGSATEIASGADTIAPTAQQPAPVAPSAGSDPTKAAAPVPADEVLTYNERLQKSNPPADVLKTPAKSEKAAVVPPVERQAVPAAPVQRAAAPPTEKAAPQPVERRAPQAVTKEPVSAAASSATPPAANATSGNTLGNTPSANTSSANTLSANTDPQGLAYVVQVAALNVRSEADAIAKRLASKGYEAYVLESAPGSPQVFRVRVGKFGSRREAQTMAVKLQKEEQFKPWVTR